MRWAALLAAALLLAATLTVPVCAEGSVPLPEIDPEQGLSPELIGELGSFDGAVEGFGARVLRLLQNTLGSIKELGFKEALHAAGIVLAAALLCALLEDSSGGRAAAPLVGGLCIAGACIGPFGSMISLGTQTIRSLHRYSELLLPALGPLLAASGRPSAVAVTGLGLVLLELLLSLVSGLLVPLLYLFFVLSVAESALGLRSLAQLRGFVKWLLVTAVKGLMWGYSGVLTATGLISSSADGQKLRALRAAIAGMVPVVGGIVSEASGSLLSAAELLKNAAGLYGMLAVLGLCLGPFFRIGLHYLLLKLTAALAGLFGKGSQSPLLEQLSQAMGLVLALTGIACLLVLMILLLCIRTVTQ